MEPTFAVVKQPLTFAAILAATEPEIAAHPNSLVILPVQSFSMTYFGRETVSREAEVSL